MSVLSRDTVVARRKLGSVPALEVNNLCVQLFTQDGALPILRDVSLSIERGRIRGLIGESGCGKTMTALSIVRLLPPGAVITSGSIRVAGIDVLGASNAEMRKLRGEKVGFIFQDPMTTLNPVLPVGFQIKESLRAHGIATGKAADARVAELLEQMGIPSPRVRARQYPHELSGGMRQRIVIAMALACGPDLIIADEPTTALDVTIQSQILELISRLTRESNVACLWITHDLGVAASVCDDISVMYAGEVVEAGPTDRIFADPRAPYTQGLMDAVPRIDGPYAARLKSLAGSPPPVTRVQPAGCSFAERCRFARDTCRVRVPDLISRGNGHTLARCFATEPGGWLDSQRLAYAHT